MLRCRPSEITLAPSDIAYSKHSFALQQSARRDRSAKVTDILASTSPRIRRGPQRSRDDAVIHPHSRQLQRYKAGPSRLRPDNPVGNMDGTGEMSSFAINSAASLEDFSTEESYYDQSIEKYGNAAENGIGRSLRNCQGYSYALLNLHPQTYDADQTFAERNGDDSTSEFNLSSTKKSTLKSVFEKTITEEDRLGHWSLYPSYSLKKTSAEMLDHTIHSQRPITTRARFIRDKPGDLLITKRTLSPQMNQIRQTRNINDSRNLIKEEGFHYESEQSTSYATRIEAYSQTEPYRTGTNPSLMVKREELEGEYKLGREDNSPINQKHSRRLPSMNKYEILSYSVHDLAALRPRQRRTISSKSHHDLSKVLGSAACESAIVQEQALGHSYRSSLNANYYKQCPFSSSSSRHSSYASTSQIYGPPQDIPARRSSLDTTNVLNVSCFGRSCSCSSPGLVNTIADNHPPMPKSPKLNRNPSRNHKRGSLPSVKNWADFTTRSSSISEAAPETVIHECSPLDQIQHRYARIYRGCDATMPFQWRLSLSEPDHYLSKLDRRNEEPQRLFSDPLHASDAFPAEEKRKVITSNDIVSLSSPSELSIPKCRVQTIKESTGDGSSHEERTVFTKASAKNQLSRPTSVTETSFPSHPQEQHYCSHEGQQSSRLASSSPTAELSNNCIRDGQVSWAAGNKAETEIEHDPSTQSSEDYVAYSPSLEISNSSHGASTNTTNGGDRVSSISAVSSTSQATQSLPWQLSDAHLQQENRVGEDEQQMRMALQLMQLRTAGNGHGGRMDETPPREGRIESFLRS